MSFLNLELIVPTTHYTDSQRHVRHGGSPLSGHVALSATSLLPLVRVTQISVRLIQIVTSTADGEKTRRISFPLFCSPKNESPRPNVTNERAICEVYLPISTEEEFEVSPRKIISKSYFSLDIPTNLPATTETLLGTVTYAVEATATTLQDGTITQCRSVKLNRQMIQDDLKMTRHRLYFPKSNDIHGMNLSQNPTPRSGPKISFTAVLRTHWETSPAERTTEISHLVVRELRWQAEEIVKIMSKCNRSDEKYSICEQQSVRRLCNGVVKGYWGSSHNPYVKQYHGQCFEEKAREKPEIRIPFDFTIPKRAMVTDAIDLAAYELDADEAGRSPKNDLMRTLSCSTSGTLAEAITVRHQLRVELITGEDVFHRETGKLVQRKRVRTVVCPAVPLIVCELST
ncbi:hypothetical protein N7457_000669 [Penicillium paradoxum]|uniref:uncharacterized protein n=1 Tax=Penicillium paradoxum TaxID=176176 RepID=UPI002548DD1A|nr:uncharacterized protein N7457_000669 [Penicillium paradoxum]KAJ5794070.1 hypothetical protein N7457_000669 [Penicillium paradoxum]